MALKNGGRGVQVALTATQHNKQQAQLPVHQTRAVAPTPEFVRNRKTAPSGAGIGKFYSPDELLKQMKSANETTANRKVAYEKVSQELERVYSSAQEKRKKLELLDGRLTSQYGIERWNQLKSEYDAEVEKLGSLQSEAQSAYTSYQSSFDTLSRLQGEYQSWKGTVRRGLTTNEIHSLNREKEGLEKINAQLNRDMAAVGSFGSAAFQSQMEKNRSRIAEIDQQLSNTPQADEKKAQAKVEELTKLINGLGAVNRQLEKDSASVSLPGTVSPIQNQIEANRARIRELEQELQQANAAVQTAKDEAKWNDYFRYADRMEEADFDRLSKYKTTANGREVKRSGADSFYETGFDNIVYDYINRNPEAVKLQSSRNMKEDLSYLEKMTDEEIGIYNYVYAKEGPQAASEYLEHIRTDLTGRRREDLEQDLAEQAKKNPVAASALSVMLSPVKGASFLGQTGQMLTQGRIDENAGYNAASYMSSAIRDAVSKTAEEKWGKVGSFLYQTGMSMGDFLLSGSMAAGSPGLALAIMGTGAAADTTIAAKDRGLSDKQAYWLGAAAGLAEVATEKFSIDALLDKSGMGKSAWGYIKKNMFAEGGEEVGSELFNFLIDILISKDQSQWQQSIEGYVSDGMSREQAFAMAVGDQAANVFNAGAGGALSGGVMGAGAVTLNRGRSPEADVKTEVGGEDAQLPLPTKEQLIQQVKSYPPTVENNELVERLEQAKDDDEANRIHDSVYGSRAVAESSDAGTRGYSGGIFESSAKERIITSMSTNLRTAEDDRKLSRIREAKDDMEATAIYYDVEQSKIDSVRRVMELTGIRNVQFMNETGKGGKVLSGKYSQDEDMIYINARSKMPEITIFGHELTHSIESAKAYSKLSSLVQKRIAQTGGDWKSMLSGKIAEYDRASISLDESAAEKELVAQYVAENLLSNEQEIRELVNQDRTLGQRILEWVDRMLAKFKNKNARERVFLRDARELYATALAQSHQNRSKIEAIQQANAQLANGDITEEQYDSIRESIDRRFGDDPDGAGADMLEAYMVSDENEADPKALYRGKPVSQNVDAFQYDNLVSLPNMEAVSLPEVPAVRDGDKVSAAKVIENGIKNALSVGEERAGKIYVTNRYTGKELRIDVSSIRHGLDGGANRILTNARLGSVIGNVVQNAVPINALQNKATGVTGTYAMAAYAVDSSGREFVAIVTVEERDSNVAGIEAFDVTHSVSGRQKRSKQADTKSQGVYPSMLASEISIADLLEAVKQTYQSILPENVLAHMGETKNRDGYYYGRTQYSVGDDESQTGNALEANKETGTENSIPEDVWKGQSASIRHNLIHAGKKLTEELAQKLRMPERNRREYLDPLMPEVWRDYLTNMKIGGEIENKLFQTAYRHGDVLDYHEAYQKFQEAMLSINEDLKWVERLIADEKRYAVEVREKQNANGNAEDLKEAETETRKITMEPEEVSDLLQRTRKARYKADRTEALTALTRSDKEKLRQLMRGEIKLSDLDPKEDYVDGISKAYEAKQEYERLAKEVQAYRKQLKSQRLGIADKLLKNAEAWDDKAAGIFYDRETMERNIRDIVDDPKVAQEIIDTYITPVKKGNAAATRLKEKFRNEIRALKISSKAAKGNKVSEAYAVQFLGEARDYIRQLEYTKKDPKYKNVTREGKTLEEWEAEVENFHRENPNLDMAKIDSAISTFRRIYEDLFKMINEVRIRNGYEPMGYRQGYFPHFESWEATGFWSRIGEMLGFKQNVTELPTTISGRTDSFRPGIRWMSNALTRKGYSTTYNALEGFDRYIETAADVIYLTDSIQNIRALSDQVRYRTSDEALKEQVDEIRAMELKEEDKQEMVRAVYEKGRFSLSHFANALDEYANILAGKKSRGDREMERLLGRKSYNLARWVEKQTGANMVAGNISSALTNFVPLQQGAATIKMPYFLRGMAEGFGNRNKKDGFRSRSTFLTNRQGSAALEQNAIQKASNEIGGWLMEHIDTRVAESLVRGRYYENLSLGMSEEAAMDDADAYVGGLMGDRSKGAMPALFYQTNPLTKLFTQFQLEVNNQYGFMFKDMPRDAADEGRKSLGYAIFAMLLGAFSLNDLLEKLLGRRVAFDPLNIINETVGDITGYQLPNVLDIMGGAINGEMPSFETEKEDVWDTIVNLGGNIAEELPFVSALNLIGINIDAGRIPVASAIPNIPKLVQAATDSDWSAEKKMDVAWDELQKPLTYLFSPFAGGQIKKTLEGVQAFRKGGSYTVDNEGNELLQYPVYSDNPLEWAMNAGQALLFGKSSLATARDWVDSGFKSFGKDQTEAYRAMVKEGASQRSAYELVDEIRNSEKTEDESKLMVQRRVLLESELPDEAKSMAYKYLLASDKEVMLMNELEEAGADAGEVGKVLLQMKDADARLAGAQASNAMRDVIANSSLNEEHMKQIYRSLISESRDDEIQAFQAAGLDFRQFLKVQNQYSTINEMDVGATAKATELARWINRNGFTATEAGTIKENFKFYSMFPAQATQYEKGITAGLSDEKAYALATSLESLEPSAGESKVTDVQNWRAACKIAYGAEEQMTALKAVMTENTYKKLSVGFEYGVDPTAYIRLSEILPQFDENGNGSYTNAEVKAAIDSMSATGLVLPGGDGTIFFLTNAQKAVLWQLFTTSSSAKNNPYDSDVGWAVINTRKAE